MPPPPRVSLPQSSFWPSFLPSSPRPATPRLASLPAARLLLLLLPLLQHPHPPPLPLLLQHALVPRPEEAETRMQTNLPP